MTLLYTVHSTFVRVDLYRFNYKTIPQLELINAALAIEIFLLIMRELKMHLDDVFFWLYSTIVSFFIKSRSGRTIGFAACKIADIHQASSPDQWFHVVTDVNPADCATRGTCYLQK